MDIHITMLLGTMWILHLTRTGRTEGNSIDSCLLLVVMSAVLLDCRVGMVCIHNQHNSLTGSNSVSIALEWTTFAEH